MCVYVFNECKYTTQTQRKSSLSTLKADATVYGGGIFALQDYCLITFLTPTSSPFITLIR
jgi:hypothetical protein